MIAKSKLSIALATFNEEKNIEDCLKSVKNIADEIVIVDGTSTDKTIQIAKSFGTKIIKTTNKPMFHINKNLAFANCQMEWILLLDADERLTPELSSEIKKVISSNLVENGFWINRKNWFLGGYLKKGGAYPDPVIRLFRNGKGILPEITVHEQVKVQGDVGHLKNDIIHLADPNFQRYLERANHYTTETAEKLAGQKAGTNFISAVYYMILKPLKTFLSIYIRHKGYQDGFRGFVWAFFSGTHHFLAYIKYWQKATKPDPINL